MVVHSDHSPIHHSNTGDKLYLRYDCGVEWLVGCINRFDTTTFGVILDTR